MGSSSDSARARIQQSLEGAVRDGVSPGMSAACALFKDGAWQCLYAASGTLEQGDAKSAQVGVDTPYDLASVTKPFVAMATLALAARSEIDLTVPVAKYLPELAGTYGGEQSLDRLLSHRAGLSPWGGLFHAIPGAIGSIEARAYILREAASRTDPNPPASGSVYSDLGYLIAGEALARCAGLSLEEVVAREITLPLQIDSKVFYAAALAEEARRDLTYRAAPTEYCEWRERVIHGEVHDENAAAFGGIAGHAGLFGTAEGVLLFGMAILDVLAGRSAWLSPAILRWALTPRAGGGHVIGWDTKSETGSSAGALFSASSFGHLGFTGTSLWCDPERELCAVLLSNRVHPTRDNLLIRSFRPRFHDAVVEAVG